jgi:hypothetical protein
MKQALFMSIFGSAHHSQQALNSAKNAKRKNVQSLTDECSDTRNIIAATEIKPDIYI